MKTKDLETTAGALYKRLQLDGYSATVIKNFVWVLSHFKNYCEQHGHEEITVPVAAAFTRECFGFDYYNLTAPFQTILRRPLMTIMEFAECGNYLKTHQKGSNLEIPLSYKDLYLRYRDVINATALCRNSKERKLWIFIHLFTCMEAKGITDTKCMTPQNIHEYVNALPLKYAPATIRTFKTVLREILDWLYAEKESGFSGRAAFPLIRKDPRKKMLSYYTKDEVSKILESIGNETLNGKLELCIVSLITYLGIRSGDVAKLKIEDIDWENNSLHILQQKTGRSLTLPLIDEVKYPLIDYLRSRKESRDPEYVFVTCYAPYTRISASSVNRVVSKCIEQAGIEIEGRHHGPHALRHSLATNMLSENVPISAIANILGHENTKTTEIYLSVDETHLKEIALEVPAYEN